MLWEFREDILAHFAFPQLHWSKIRSTNLLERLNREIARRADVVGIFPNRNSLLRLIGMVLLEQNDEWQAERRYLSLEAMALLKLEILEGGTISSEAMAALPSVARVA
ncbi:Transposase, Mutator family [compost metagenome]